MLRLSTAVLIFSFLTTRWLPAQQLTFVPVSDVKQVNTIAISMPESRLSQMHSSKGEKISLKISDVIVNGDTLEVKHARVRGSSSSHFRRKSFNIKTAKKCTFSNGDDAFSLKKFYAISMNMDRNYIHNKISYEVMHLVGVHAPLNDYANFLINGRSEGLYLVFYPPDEYAMNKCNAPFVVRRGYHASVDKVYMTKDVDKVYAKDLRKKFTSLYTLSVTSRHGEALYNEMSEILDLDGYFTWLAFNHLFQNGDYSDEAYFAWNSQVSRFEIIPWDFDDILMDKPHEGVEVRAGFHPEKLMFSLEDNLDRKIADDAFLYNKYLERYHDFLEKLTSQKLAEVLDKVFHDVYPYISQEEIIAQSRFDLYGATSMALVQSDLNNIYRTISRRAETVRRKIGKATQ